MRLEVPNYHMVRCGNNVLKLTKTLKETHILFGKNLLSSLHYIYMLDYLHHMCHHTDMDWNHTYSLPQKQGSFQKCEITV